MLPTILYIYKEALSALQNNKGLYLPLRLPHIKLLTTR